MVNMFGLSCLGRSVRAGVDIPGCGAGNDRNCGQDCWPAGPAPAHYRGSGAQTGRAAGWGWGSLVRWAGRDGFPGPSPALRSPGAGDLWPSGRPVSGETSDVRHGTQRSYQ